MNAGRRVLYVVVCAAGPANEVATLVTAAQGGGWDVHLFATPAAVDFLDLPLLESLSGHPVHCGYHDRGQTRSSTPHADAIVVAPATYATAAANSAHVDGEVPEIPMDRLGVPGDAATAAVYLASPLSSYVTGQSLVVDGGVTVRGPFAV